MRWNIKLHISCKKFFYYLKWKIFYKWQSLSFQPNEKIAFVEFGSGRGQLTYWVAKATNNDSESKSNNCEVLKHKKDAKFILIDKASHRHKFDNKLKDEAPQLSTTRIRVDIEDVVLGEIDALSDRVRDKYTASLH